MKITFISDLHLSADNMLSAGLFDDFCDKIIGQCDKLYILGDLFEYWVGDDGAVALGHDRVERQLQKLVDSGIQVLFMRGNRDFIIGQAFFERTGVTELVDPCIVDINGKPVLLCHGDSLCTDDIEHQKAREMMLNPKWQEQALAQPLEVRLQQANNLREQSKMSKSGKSMEIMDVNQQAVEKLMLEHDVTTLIHGHTHKPAIHHFMMNNRPAMRIVLGDWYEQSSVLTFDENGFKFYT